MTDLAKKKLEVIKLINTDIDYYHLTDIRKMYAHYNIIYGERSNGKSFAVELEGLLNYLDKGEKMAIIRRYDVDFQGKRGQSVFSHFIKNEKYGNLIEILSEGKWSDIYYFSMRWYFCKYNDRGDRIRDAEPFCYAFALGGVEHDKSISFPEITTVLFDEFMTRGIYLNDEFIAFENVLSTIIRDRDNVTIYMCGNTVNKYNPYFKEMGLENVLKMNKGDIQLYQFAAYFDKKTNKEIVLKVAVEYSDSPNKEGKKSDVYFAFNNPKLKMITNGMWEMALYPHLPYKYESKDVIGEYFIKWEDEIKHCEIINLDGIVFTYIHNKSTLIKDEDMDIVFSTEYNPRINYRRKITKPIDNIGKKIYWFFQHDKVFYQDNEVGEVIRNYIQWCNTDRGFV